MLKDEDLRVIPSVLSSLRSLKAPEVERVLLEWLTHDDPVVRAAAATELGELKPAGGEAALVARVAGRRAGPDVRRAGARSSRRWRSTARQPPRRRCARALADADFAVRVRAASLLAAAAPGEDFAAAIRPAPTRHPPELLRLPRNWSHPTVSPHLFVETDRGTIEIELAVLDAPRHVRDASRRWRRRASSTAC